MGETSTSRDWTHTAPAASTLDDIDLLNADTFVKGVPHDDFKRLRRHAPVFWHRDPEGPGFWAITKYQDLIAI